MCFGNIVGCWRKAATCSRRTSGVASDFTPSVIPPGFYRQIDPADAARDTVLIDRQAETKAKFGIIFNREFAHAGPRPLASVVYGVEAGYRHKLKNSRWR